MMNGNKSSLVVGASALVIGFCVGVSTGILIAPHAGAQTRRHLNTFAEDMIEDTAEVVDEVIERGKRLIAI